MPLEYLFEFHYRDGRTERRRSGKYDDRTRFEIGTTHLIDGTRWRVREVIEAYGYDAKVVLDEDD